MPKAVQIKVFISIISIDSFEEGQTFPTKCKKNTTQNNDSESCKN